MTEPLAAWTLGYRPGAHLLLSGPTMLVVMPTPPPSMAAEVEALWRGALAQRSADAFLAFLASEGFDAMPHVAACFWDERGLHGLVRGDLRILDADGEPAITDDGAVTWREAPLTGDTYSIVFGDAAEEGPTLPLAVGVALVERVTLTTRDEQLVRLPDPAPESEEEPELQPEPEPDGVASEPAVEASGEEPVLLDETPEDDPRLADDPEPGDPEPEPEPEPEDVEEQPAGDPEPGDPEPDPDPEDPEDIGVVSAVPPPPKPAQDAQPEPEPEVVAAPCAQGHPNPPEGGRCLWCPAPVDAAHARSVRRPVIAGVHSNHGDFLDLTAPVVVGRAPDASHATEGAQLLRVPSPGNDISRSHLRIEADGWGVVVTDLRSTNGTAVRIPGESEFELRDGRSATVAIGTILDLGDGSSLRIEPPRSFW